MKYWQVIAGTALFAAAASVAPAQTPPATLTPAVDHAMLPPGDPATADIPPGAHAGQCFARVLVPLRTESYTEQVIDKAEHQDVRVVDAVYGWDEKDVVIKEGRSEFVTIPATYKTITETVTVRAASRRVVTIPAVYETTTEKVLVRAATTTWKRGIGLIGYTVVGHETRKGANGDILCLVEVPAVYEEVSHQKLVKAEETKVIDEPAVTEVVTREIVDTPARVEEHKIPAITKHVKVHTLISDAHTDMITIPATHKAVTKFKVVGGGNVEWREILCDTNTTREVIIRVQAALADKGFFKGRRNGVFGPESWAALVSFQRSNHLPEGQLTLETVHALNIEM